MAPFSPKPSKKKTNSKTSKSRVRPRKSEIKINSRTLFIDLDYDVDEKGKRIDAHLDKTDFSLGGLQWKLVTRKLINAEEFSFGIWIELSEECEQSLSVEYQIQLRYNWTATTSKGEVCEKGECSIGFPRKRPASVLKSNVDHLELSLKCEFFNFEPHHPRVVERIAAKEEKCDCKIVLVDDEKKNVFVHKTILAETSPFFNTLFFGEFKERNEDVVNLHFVSEEEFLKYLDCLYPPIRPFAFKRMDTLLRLADRFQNDELLSKIENFLLGGKFVSRKRKTRKKRKFGLLVWADAYRMPTLFAQTVESMNKTELASLDEKKCSKFCELNSAILKKRIAYFASA